jgi:hypothetical protein
MQQGRGIVEMNNEELSRVRRWIADYRERRLDRAGLTDRLMGSGYRESDARRFADLIVSTSA